MFLYPLCILATANAFVVPSPVRRPGWVSLKATTLTGELGLEEIARKLRLRVFDENTGVYGLESKDPSYGIENVHTRIGFDPSLGLELTEVAHSDLDHRGLVLVSKVEGHALHETPIMEGDVVIGVFAGDEFKESTTGMDYDGTVEAINRAKRYASERDLGSISLELNQVVKRAKVCVEVEDDDNKVTSLDALAGDNLRLLLMHHHAKLYDERTHRIDQPNLTGNCGGEGICGTCLVAVREGMGHLNKVGPQEESILRGRPQHWRAACKTVVGADNQEGTTLRIGLHPQTSDADDSQLLRP